MRKGWGDVVDDPFADVTAKVSGIDNISILKIISKCYSAPFILNWPNREARSIRAATQNVLGK